MASADSSPRDGTLGKRARDAGGAAELLRRLVDLSLFRLLITLRCPIR
jgi:hypothetical protein